MKFWVGPDGFLTDSAETLEYKYENFPIIVFLSIYVKSSWRIEFNEVIVAYVLMKDIYILSYITNGGVDFLLWSLNKKKDL